MEMSHCCLLCRQSFEYAPICTYISTDTCICTQAHLCAPIYRESGPTEVRRQESSCCCLRGSWKVNVHEMGVCEETVTGPLLQKRILWTLSQDTTIWKYKDGDRMWAQLRDLLIKKGEGSRKRGNHCSSALKKHSEIIEEQKNTTEYPTLQ